MTHRFDPKRQLVVVKTRLVGPTGDVVVHLAVDTGASSTLIGWHALNVVGYSPANAFEEVEMITGSGVEKVPRIKAKRLEALGKRRLGLGIVGHTLPPSATIDGLLGLDFFRRSRLTIDFRKSLVKID